MQDFDLPFVRARLPMRQESHGKCQTISMSIMPCLPVNCSTRFHLHQDPCKVPFQSYGFANLAAEEPPPRPARDVPDRGVKHGPRMVLLAPSIDMGVPRRRWLRRWERTWMGRDIRRPMAGCKKVKDGKSMSCLFFRSRDTRRKTQCVCVMHFPEFLSHRGLLYPFFFDQAMIGCGRSKSCAERWLEAIT